MNTYDIGDVILLKANFKVSTVATDPSTVECSVKGPDNNITNLVYGVAVELVRENTGFYHAEFTPTQSGTYYVKWRSTGIAAGVEEKTFFVRKSNVS